MSWKNTLPFFIWQSLKYADGRTQFSQLWSYRKRWSDSFKANRNSVVDEMPWINFPACEYLEKNLRPEYKVFEYGGGGSTLFFCKNVAEVTTVEDNETWFATLTKIISQKGYKNWNGEFIVPEPVEGNSRRSPENPMDFASKARGKEGLSFERYARSIDRFPEAYFDLILVDGRARPSCIQQALPHLKKGGLLVVDNTERPYYLAPFQDIIRTQFKTEVDRYAPVAYTPDFTKTTVLRKL